MLGPLEKSLSRESGPGAGASFGPGAGVGGCGGSARAVVAQTSLINPSEGIAELSGGSHFACWFPPQLGSGSWTGARRDQAPQQEAMPCSRSAAARRAWRAPTVRSLRIKADPSAGKGLPNRHLDQGLVQEVG